MTILEIIDKSLNVTNAYVSQITENVNKYYCSGNFFDFFLLILLPLLLILFLLFLLLFKEQVKTKFLLMFSDRGYIRVWFLKENKKLQSKLIKLDKFNMFNIGKRRFILEKMHNFIIGYDNYNFPIFLYDHQFILPFKIEKKKIDRLIEEEYDISEMKPEEKDDFISQITMSIDSSILKLVYDKKLMSDLYSISRGSLLESRWFWLIVGVFGIAILYYTGYLDKIINMVTG